MIFKLLHYALLFLLPFLIYGVWIVLAKRRHQNQGSASNWSDAPYYWLTTAGIVLSLTTLLLVAVFQGEDKGGTYVPPKIIDGEILPGEIRR